MRVKQIIFKCMILMLMLLVVSCTSDVKEAACGSTEDFNPVFRQCVPKSLGASIQIKSSTPNQSYVVSKTSTQPITHAIEVEDPFNQGYHTEWFLYRVGQPAQVLAASGDNYTYLPNTLSVGNYSMEAVVKDLDRVRVLDKATWTIVISANNAPKIINTIPTTTVINAKTSDPNISFQADIENLSNEPGYTYEFILNGVIKASGVIGNGTQNNTYSFNPADIATPGTQTLSLAVKSSAAITEEIYTWVIVVTNPDLPKFSAQEIPLAVTVTAIDSVAIGSDGFIYNNAPVSFCLQTNEFDGTQKNNLPGTELQFSIANTTTGSKVPITGKITFTANNVDLCLRNILGAYFIPLTNPDVSETKIITAELFDKQTGALSDTRDWQVVIRPKNTAPVITAVSPLTSSVVTLEQDSPLNFLFSAFDEDTSLPDEFETEFILNGISVCLNPKASGQPANLKFSCDVAVPSYGTTGPVPPTSLNTLIAVVRDTAVPLWGGVDKESNQLSWSITTTEAQTAPVVLPSPASFIALSATPASPITAAIEGDSVRFNVVIQDQERDNLLITLQKCELMTGVCGTNLVVDEPLTKTDGNINTVWTKDVVLDQNTLIGATTGAVYFQVIVKDVPDTVASMQGEFADADRLVLNMTNVNPAPEISGVATPAASIRVITGVPASFDPGTVTDLSELDGQVIKYQWGISTSATGPFTDIPGADTKILTWTPPASINGITHYLQLCTSDSGTGNEFANCELAPSRFRRFTVQPVTNLVSHIGSVAATPSGEVASWFDVNHQTLYTVYPVGTPGSVSINLVQTIYNADGTTAQSTIDFTSDDALRTTTHGAVSDISITGITDPIATDYTGSLFVSYLTSQVLIPGPGSNKELRVRRIDISDDGRLGFAPSGIVIDDGGDCFTPVFADPITTITAAATCDVGDAIEINGVAFELALTAGTSGLVNLVPAVVTDPIDVSASLANVANTLGDARLLTQAGNPVNHTGGNAFVTIDHANGLYRDVLDDTAASSRVTISAGDIMIHNNEWFVPTIDVPVLSKILFQRGSVLGALAATHIQNQQPDGTSLPQATEISNSYSSNTASFVVALKANTGEVNAYNINPLSLTAAPIGVSDVFSSTSISNIRVAAGKTGNQFVYIAGQDTSNMPNKPLAIARIPQASIAGGACGAECLAENPVDDNATGLGSGIFDYEMRSSTYNQEAILSLIASDNKLYIAQVSGVTPVLKSTQAPVIVTPLIAATGIGFGLNMTELINDTSPNIGITLGDPGYIPAQNTTNGFFTSYFKAGDINPESAFIDSRREPVSADANDEALGFMLPYIQ